MLRLFGGDIWTLGSGLHWFPGWETDRKCLKISKCVKTNQKNDVVFFRKHKFFEVMLKLFAGDIWTLGSGLHWFPDDEMDKTYQKMKIYFLFFLKRIIRLTIHYFLFLVDSPQGLPVATFIQFSFSNQSLSVAPFLRAPFTFVLDDLLYLP